MELRCSFDLAIRLGAISVTTVQEHREMKNAGHLLVRCPATMCVAFWPWVMTSMQRSMEYFRDGG